MTKMSPIMTILFLMSIMTSSTSATTAFTIPKIHSMRTKSTLMLGNARNNGIATQTLPKRISMEPTSFVRRKNGSKLYAHVNGDDQQHHHQQTLIEPTSSTAAGTAAAVVIKNDGSSSPSTTTTTAAPSHETTTTTGIENGRKLINTVLLTLSFGFAIYTILNIDHGMTRGWTPSEIAARIPIDNWASYESSLNAQPIFTKTIINVVIYLLGDWLSQTLFQGKDILDFDAVRTLKNGFVGMCFGPAVHAYYEFSDSILPVEIGYNKFYKIFMDQTIYLSIKCSIYIMAIGLLGGESFQSTTKNVRERIKPIMFTAWKFWPLVHCITYSVIPARHRILWVNSVDLVWNAILASKASGTIDDEEEEEEVVVEIDDKLAVVVTDNDVIQMGKLDNLTAVNGNINGDLNSTSIAGDILESDNMLELMDDPAIQMENDNHKHEKRDSRADDEEIKEVLLAQVVLDNISASSKTSFTNSSMVEMKS